MPAVSASQVPGSEELDGVGLLVLPPGAGRYRREAAFVTGSLFTHVPAHVALPSAVFLEAPVRPPVQCTDHPT